MASGCECEKSRPGNGRRTKGLTIIFKGTTACNAGCRFCSAAGNKGESVTPGDFEILVKRIEEYIAEAGIEHLNFTFHGGEPSLLGAKFLDDICARLRQLPIPVEFSLQSNLLAFPENLIEVVRRYGINVGSSVDPIESGRCTANGKDSFPAWVRNRQRLAETGVFGGAIFLVTRPSLGQGKRVYDILNSCASLGETQSAFQFNVVYAQGRANENSDLLVSPEEGGQFLVDAYKAWEESGRESHASPFAELVDWFDSGRQGTPRLTCWFMGRCHETHIGIDSDLNVAGCGRRLDSEGFFGNIRTHSIASLLASSDERKKAAKRSETLQNTECADCEYFVICHGGCPDDAALETGEIMHKTAICATYKMLFDAMAAHAGSEPVQAPKRLRMTNSVVYLATDSCGTASFVRGNDQLEYWVLPTDDGRPLKFSSRLQNVLARADKVKIFVPGDQVDRLNLWAKVVCEPNAEIVLFDHPEMLIDNLAALGRLGARARLDLESLFASGWSAEAALELGQKYLREADWKVRIQPFEDILMTAVRGERKPITNRHGLTPGHYRVCIGSTAGANEAAQRLIHELRDSESVATWSYFLDHRTCLECKSYVVCGSQLASLGAGGCSEKLRELASELQASAVEIRNNLAKECAPVG